MSCANAEAVIRAKHSAKTKTKTFFIISFPFVKSVPIIETSICLNSVNSQQPKTTGTLVLPACIIPILLAPGVFVLPATDGFFPIRALIDSIPLRQWRCHRPPLAGGRKTFDLGQFPAQTRSENSVLVRNFVKGLTTPS